MPRMLTAALLGAALAVSTTMAHAEKLTAERVFSDPDLNGPTARGVKLSPDGQLVTYLKARPEDQNALDLWAAPTQGGEPFRLVELQGAGARAEDAERGGEGPARAPAHRQHGVVEYAWDDQGKFILVPLDGDLWLAERASGKVRRLTHTPGDEIDAKVSPKGDFVSYVRDQNLYVMDLASGPGARPDHGRQGALSLAAAEFVAQEEMERFTGYWWSPDERHIALTRVDESGVDVIPRLDIGPEGVKVIDQRYPRAGRPNAVVELYVEDLGDRRAGQGRSRARTRTSTWRGSDWSKDGRTLYVQRQTRDQKRLDLLAVDPATGAAKVILTETSPHWVELNDDFKPLAGRRLPVGVGAVGQQAPLPLRPRRQAGPPGHQRRLAGRPGRGRRRGEGAGAVLRLQGHADRSGSSMRSPTAAGRAEGADHAAPAGGA